jgi:hypothetical protein
MTYPTHIVCRRRRSPSGKRITPTRNGPPGKQALKNIEYRTTWPRYLIFRYFPTLSQNLSSNREAKRMNALSCLIPFAGFSGNYRTQYPLTRTPLITDSPRHPTTTMSCVLIPSTTASADTRSITFRLVEDVLQPMVLSYSFHPHHDADQCLYFQFILLSRTLIMRRFRHPRVNRYIPKKANRRCSLRHPSHLPLGTLITFKHSPKNPF